MIETLTDLNLDPLAKELFEQNLLNNRDDLLKQFKKSKDDIIKMSDIVKSVVIHAESNNWNEINAIWNIIGFILLASLDMKTYLELMIIAEDNIQKIALVRMVYTQLYEISNDILNETNIRFIEKLQKVNCSALVDELYQKRKDINLFKKKYEKDLFAVRINVGAHREKNYIVFHNFLTELDYTAAMKLVFEFSSLIDNLASTLQKIMQISADFVTKKEET